MIPANTMFLSGVIEGFYGCPWSPDQRLLMVDEIARCGLNTYLYAPKFDLHHRTRWQDPYPHTQLRHFEAVCRKGKQSGVNIVLALSPGLTVTSGTVRSLQSRFRDLYQAGPSGLALLLDDIPYDRADPDSHADILLALMNAIPGQPDWYFCPTAYSGYHLKTWQNASSYIDIIGNRIPAECHVFWTGNSIVSKTVEPGDLIRVRQALKRKPLLWDNYHADDYVPASAFFPGPFTGRSPDITRNLNGILINPSEIFCASQMAVFTFSEWISDPHAYIPENAFEHAIAKLVCDAESRSVLCDLFGYFYTPFAVSKSWQVLLQHFVSYYREPATTPSPEPLIASIRNRLRDDANIYRMKDIWPQVYPFVRTLLGDCDFLIDVCHRIRDGSSQSLPFRDPRWSTPVMDILSRLRCGEDAV